MTHPADHDCDPVRTSRARRAMALGDTWECPECGRLWKAILGWHSTQQPAKGPRTWGPDHSDYDEMGQ